MRVSRTPPASAAAPALPRSAGVSSASGDRWPSGSFIDTLADAERAALLRSGPLVRIGNDEVLMLQGDVGDFLYVLTDGKVKVLVAAESGAETMLAIRSRGDLVGEFTLLDSKPRTATARAIGTVTARRVSRADFADFIAAFPAAEDRVFRYVLGKMRESTARHAAERVWGARERLAQELYDLAREHGAPRIGRGGADPDHPGRARPAGGRGGVHHGTGAQGVPPARHHRHQVRRHRGQGLAALEMIRFSEEVTQNP